MMNKQVNSLNFSGRIDLVDALRGFALLGIILIHFVEHFELFKAPVTNFYFSPEINETVTQIVFFLVSGKAYSIFAIMFGFSFFIQMNRKEENGIDFRKTFIWRLTILFVLGLIHSLIYRGDILNIYAFLGFFLVLFYNVKSNYLLVWAAILVLQLPLLYHLGISIFQDNYNYVEYWGGNAFANCEEIYAHGSLWDVINANIWEGRKVVWAWTYNTGRFVQLFALFLVGLYLGRTKFFEQVSIYKNQLVKVIAISLLLVVLFHYQLVFLSSTPLSDSQKKIITLIIKSFNNLAYTGLLMAIFILIYNKLSSSWLMKSFAIYGRMSLTNYVSQAIFGVIFFYGFGFGMYAHLGAVWSLLIGIVFFYLQVVISRYWIKNYYYGPLEWFWRALTYRTIKLKFRKQIR